MALPDGVTTCTVIAGVPVTHAGGPVKTYVSIEPSVFLVHTATGTPLVDFLEENEIAEGVAGQFTLPHTDQAGFQDENGNAYTNWYYTARITYRTPSGAKVKAPKLKVFQLTTGQTSVDLDRLPGGAPALPYTAPIATVTSVAGLTGPVTGAQVAALPELAATYALKWKANTAYAVGDAVLSPSGDTVTAKVTFTSGATYDAANWNPSPALAAKADVRAIRVGTRSRLHAAPIKHMIPANMPGHGWTLQSDVSNNASSDLNDTTDFLIGSQALRITTAGTAAYVGWDKTLTAPIDASDCDFRFWFKLEDPDRRLANIQIIIGDSALTWRSTITAFSYSSATSYIQSPLQAGRWNILDVPQAAGWTPTGTPNWAAVQRVLVKASDTAGKPITVRLGGVAFTQRNHNNRFPNGVATLTFDDSYDAAYNYGRVKMDQYGYRGTLFPIIDRIGMSGKLTLAQIQSMYQNGWDVAGHAYTNANHAIGVTAMTQADRLAELENIKAWMDTNNFQTQAYAYPLGNHDPASEADIAAYFDCGRLAFLQRDTPQAIAQPYAIQAANAGTQQATLNTFIDRAVSGKGWINFVFHDIKASGATGNDISQANFDALLSYLASSGIAVRTMSEVLATLT